MNESQGAVKPDLAAPFLYPETGRTPGRGAPDVEKRHDLCYHQGMMGDYAFALQEVWIWRDTKRSS